MVNARLEGVAAGVRCRGVDSVGHSGQVAVEASVRLCNKWQDGLVVSQRFTSPTRGMSSSGQRSCLRAYLLARVHLIALGHHLHKAVEEAALSEEVLSQRPTDPVVRRPD